MSQTFFAKASGKYLVHSLEALFACMWASYKVRSDDILGQVSLEMFRAICPAPLKAWCADNWESLRKVTPSQSTISRARLPFDCCWLLFWRDKMRCLLSSKHVFFSYMTDASPMMGRDWLIQQYDVIDLARIPDMFGDMEVVAKANADGVAGDDTTKTWQAALMPHVCIPTGIGSKRATLPHKLHNVLHALRLELGSWDNVKLFAEKMVAITTDCGTEAGIVSVPTDILDESFLPQIHVDGDPDGDFIGPWWASGDAGPEDGEGGAGDRRVLASLLFPNTLWIPGCCHLLHTVAGEVPRALGKYTDWFAPKLQKACLFLSTPYLVERFKEQCLRSAAAADFRQLFAKSVDAKLAEWRWMSLTHCLELLLERQAALMLFFSPKEMLFNEKAAADEQAVAVAREHPGENEVRDSNMAVLNGIFKDPVFWAYAHMLDGVASVLVDLDSTMWACPCHPDRRRLVLERRRQPWQNHTLFEAVEKLY